jgi:hypothetical protein
MLSNEQLASIRREVAPPDKPLTCTITQDVARGMVEHIDAQAERIDEMTRRANVCEERMRIAEMRWDDEKQRREAAEAAASRQAACIAKLEATQCTTCAWTAEQQRDRIAELTAQRDRARAVAKDLYSVATTFAHIPELKDDWIVGKETT